MKETLKKILPPAGILIGFLIPIIAVAILGVEAHPADGLMNPPIVSFVPFFFIGKFGSKKLSKADEKLLKILVTPLLWICFPIIPIYKVLKLLFKH